ncbi:glycosyltransferase family A protein [Flavobacterium sp. K5-23]|uniref:glycosyltransferase family A protein n=1 Tax=Flavobacterium sp. K5-23 TaxID=2746225 RepID=UPI00200C0D45|nr:glycosyltransferase family 2 protein [Flavobacterium sp. K5-23]UQD56157.1 glycosyltransferase [Flavobacterium sp. K5-23]
MRVGFNPNKDKIQEPNDFFHQVIIPIYIPNQEGYFKDSFQILRFCLESLFKTCHSQTYITVVNNGSCDVVVQFLQQLLSEKKIHELIHSTNIGYVNAMLKGIVGHDFQIVTTSDADVLFLNDWQKESYKLFDTFPKAGAICPTPSSKTLKFYSYNQMFDCIFSKKMKFTIVKNPNAMRNFASSIGNPNFYNEFHLNKFLTVTNNNIKAVVGAGHYIVTYKGCIFINLTEKYSGFVLGGGSDDLLDKPVVKQGYWRIATEYNYTYHMGNIIEPWMAEKFNMIEDQSNLLLEKPSLKQINQNEIANFIKEKIFMRFLIIKPVWNLFLKYKGLSNEEANHY